MIGRSEKIQKKKEEEGQKLYTRLKKKEHDKEDKNSSQ